MNLAAFEELLNRDSLIAFVYGFSFALILTPVRNSNSRGGEFEFNVAQSSLSYTTIDRFNRFTGIPDFLFAASIRQLFYLNSTVYSDVDRQIVSIRQRHSLRRSSFS